MSFHEAASTLANMQSTAEPRVRLYSFPVLRIHLDSPEFKKKLLASKDKTDQPATTLPVDNAT